LVALSFSHCMQRAERFRIKMLVTRDVKRRSRLHNISHNYRRLADRARKEEAAATTESSPPIHENDNDNVE
jgi:hypothetical protein